MRSLQVDHRHAASAEDAGGKRASQACRNAREMAGQAVDRLIDPSAPDEERQRRERRLLKGPKEFRDIRDNRVKPKR